MYKLIKKQKFFYKDAAKNYLHTAIKKQPSFLVNKDSILSFKHKDSQSLEFNRDQIIPYASTNLGPHIAVSDINNDGYLDIYVTDMAPSDHIKSKVFMASMDTKKFHSFVDHGMHYQYMLNTLQLNNGDNTFREIGQLAGIDKTEWTWASLFLDIDFDGNKDLFITNGIKENTNDNDLNEKLKSRQKELKKP